MENTIFTSFFWLDEQKSINDVCTKFVVQYVRVKRVLLLGLRVCEVFNRLSCPNSSAHYVH